MCLPLCKDAHDPVARDARAWKAGKKMWQAIFYVCAVIYGYDTLKKTDWLPWYLGGSGSFENFSTNVPYHEVPDGIIDYYMFELGYIAGASIEHIFFEEVTNDYTMYILHHVCAVSLIISSYISNFLGIGTLILFHLDLADIFTNAASGFGQTKYDSLAAINFFIMMGVWIYTRLLILPWLVYKCFNNQHAIIEPFWSYGYDNVLKFSAFMLLLLCIMNYVWFYMFC
jgi:hypothetical protein